ncbi:PepSY-associated TM helix domain-containing protein [Pseudomonas sp. RL_15y_Pfl2_60]|uniref:PepSY-associated TM helix domain-containing protein n=1 Tax=Pseudomonas sp. RL_15y_Pfl2_60 TaxID=3088709 RepID=UPI0030DB8A33
MKAQSLTQSMSWLHTWVGLVFGWLLFAIFLTGTLAVFDKEIDVWMRPEAPAHKVDQTQAAQRAIAYLQAKHAGASAWNIGLPTERSPGLTVSAGEQRRGGPRQYLDPATAEPVAVRATAGGGHFFRFHFTLNMPRNIGIWLVGFAAIGMLVALFSSLIIHKKFFKEFFTFRPGKGQRSWLDAHNATGVLVLPFHLMITYTGLVIFSLIYMPAAVDALFDGDRQAAFGRDQHEHRGAAKVAAVTPAQLTAIGPVLAEAERVMGEIGSLSISNPGRSDARIEARPVLGNRIELTKGKSMVFDGLTGKVVKQPEQNSGAILSQRVIAGLHFAQFGGYPMRWLYFLCSLASCAMIATGLVLFTVKRRRRHDAEGPVAAWLYKVAERLNVAIVAGLSIACIGYLWANRLLPVELEGRGALEVRVFFAIWLLSLGHACCRPYIQAWREQLGLAALMCLLLPLLSSMTLENPRAESIRLYVEITILGCGALLAFCAWRTGQSKARVAPRRQSPAAAQVQ